MNSTAATTATTATRECDPHEIVAQIGRNIFGISGGRVQVTKSPEGFVDGIEMPAGAGYHVVVKLAADDTYVVERQFRRSGKVTVHGTRPNVYCDEVSEAAYFASCFRSYNKDVWVQRR